jgi:hypothetical protein
MSSDPDPPQPPARDVDLVAFLAAWSISAMFPDPRPPSKAEGVLFGRAADEIRRLRAECERLELANQRTGKSR